MTRSLTTTTTAAALLLALGACGIPATPAETTTTAAAASPAASISAKASAAAPAKAPATTAGTLSQRNALAKAEAYLDFKGFSRKGLIQQLSSSAGDGYPKADATWAVDHLTGVNWNEQAVRAGKAYLDFTSFSRAGLIQQLSSDAGDGFTKAQATYAVNKLGL